jgi:tetrahydromethanopterin S-methyltransferase subunit A
MTRKEYTPEEWPDVRGDYQRLVGLARRRLVGFEHHAEDVVTRAVMKWATIPAAKKPVARIEQVIKTEAYSVIRSERRLKEREGKVARNPFLPDFKVSPHL